MTAPEDEHGTRGGDRPVEIKDVLDVPENDAEKPSDQPSLPDFNS